MTFNGKTVKGVLLDITGVLVESSAVGDGIAIQGSIEAIKRLNSAGKIRLNFESKSITSYKVILQGFPSDS